MDMYLQEEKLMISAENIPEFQKLLRKAEKEAEQLNQTLNQLSHFDFSIRFSVESSSQAGEIEAASSAIDTIPKKDNFLDEIFHVRDEEEQNEKL